jgi:hypothetical protein
MANDTSIVKQLIMYSNDAVEASFADGMKIFLAPCATEYVIQQGNFNQGELWELPMRTVLILVFRVRHDDDEASHHLHDE